MKVNIKLSIKLFIIVMLFYTMPVSASEVSDDYALTMLSLKVNTAHETIDIVLTDFITAGITETLTVAAKINHVKIRMVIPVQSLRSYKSRIKKLNLNGIMVRVADKGELGEMVIIDHDEVLSITLTKRKNMRELETSRGREITKEMLDVFNGLWERCADVNKVINEVK